MTTLINGWITRVLPQEVEYRQASGSGVRVVRIFLGTITPRIISFCETSTLEQIPMSLFLDELILLVDKAQELSSLRA